MVLKHQPKANGPESCAARPELTQRGLGGGHVGPHQPTHQVGSAGRVSVASPLWSLPHSGCSCGSLSLGLGLLGSLWKPEQPPVLCFLPPLPPALQVCLRDRPPLARVSLYCRHQSPQGTQLGSVLNEGEKACVSPLPATSLRFFASPGRYLRAAGCSVPHVSAALRRRAVLVILKRQFGGKGLFFYVINLIFIHILSLFYFLLVL